MLLQALQLSKSIGTKVLFEDANFSLRPGEKVALIGRNGYGKTSLLKILGGMDPDFLGKFTLRKGARVTLTQQEHHQHADISPLDYIVNSAPDYYPLKDVIEKYEAGESSNLDEYLRALEIFTDRNYFNLFEAVLSTLDDFGLSASAAHEPLVQLSGGQKRYVEMVRMMFSQADLFLIDEPTNHMDYQGKERFIQWMRQQKAAVIVVSHDRDVLKHVQQIIELKDQRLYVFDGNYDKYIQQNTLHTISSVKQYSDQLNRLKEAKKRVDWGLRMRAKSKEWKTRYDHWLRDYEQLKAETVKPSFWIDQSSVEEIDEKVADSYHAFKEKNIKISITAEHKKRGELIKVRQLTLGYDHPLFHELSFSLNDGARIGIKGKNGAGKSTLVRTIVSIWSEQQPTAKVLSGSIHFGNGIRIGEYQQEIHERFLPLSLTEAITQSYREAGESIDERKVRSLLAQYLFDPVMDVHKPIEQLSGGQKARFQLIRMFIGDPNVLILDEPTNHLDLPSIEELENALGVFPGGILYISHDSYFITTMGGDIVEV